MTLADWREYAGPEGMVWAHRALTPLAVGRTRPRICPAGSWVVSEADGALLILTDRYFRARYRPAEPPLQIVRQAA